MSGRQMGAGLMENWLFNIRVLRQNSADRTTR
jgi:hypothetical protein